VVDGGLVEVQEERLGDLGGDGLHLSQTGQQGGTSVECSLGDLGDRAVVDRHAGHGKLSVRLGGQDNVGQLALELGRVGTTEG